MLCDMLQVLIRVPYPSAAAAVIVVVTVLVMWYPLCHADAFLIYLVYLTCIIKALCLQCFDAVGWVAGRASGL